MITIKLPIITQIDISKYQKQFNNIARFAYNRFQEGKTQSQIEKLVKSTMNNIDLMDSSFIKSAVDSVKQMKNQKVIFGGKKNWNDYNNNLKTKQEYQKNKLRPISVRGSKLDNRGNRKFQLDIIDNNRIIFKPNKKTKIYLNIPKTKHHSTLILLQRLCEVGQEPFTCAITNESVHITFDETILRKENYVGKKKRILAIDSNPNYVSYVITDHDKVLKKEIIGLKELNEASTNKKKHEDYEIVKRIVEIAKHYKVKHIIHEKLSIESSDKGKGKKFNKLCNNNWRRNRFFENLNKRCNIIGIHIQAVIPEYSSFIGQINHENEYDSIAAALELARRGLLYLSKYYYNENVNVEGGIVGIKQNLSNDLADRWKKKLDYEKVFVTYESLYKEIKKMKYSYRHFFQFNWFSFRLKSCKSLIYVH